MHNSFPLFHTDLACWNDRVGKKKKKKKIFFFFLNIFLKNCLTENRPVLTGG